MEVGIVGVVDPHRTMRRVGRTPPLFPALMHPTLLPRPFHHDGWVYEERIDGYRMVAVKANGAVQLISRQGCDHTKRFRELVKGLGGLKPKTFVLDGEVAVFDKDLISRFEWLGGCPDDEPATLPVYIVFDILQLNGIDLRPRPLKECRRLLERLVRNHSMVFRHAGCQTTASRRGKKPSHAATRGSWRRIRSPPTWRGVHSGGSK